MMSIYFDVKAERLDHLLLMFRIAWSQSSKGRIGFYRQCRLREDTRRGHFYESVLGTATLLLMNERQNLCEAFKEELDLEEAHQFTYEWLQESVEWLCCKNEDRRWRVFSGIDGNVDGYKVVVAIQPYRALYGS